MLHDIGGCLRCNNTCNQLPVGEEIIIAVNEATPLQEILVPRKREGPGMRLGSPTSVTVLTLSTLIPKYLIHSFSSVLWLQPMRGGRVLPLFHSSLLPEALPIDNAWQYCLVGPYMTTWSVYHNHAHTATYKNIWDALVIRARMKHDAKMLVFFIGVAPATGLVQKSKHLCQRD